MDHAIDPVAAGDGVGYMQKFTLFCFINLGNTEFRHIHVPRCPVLLVQVSNIARIGQNNIGRIG